MESGEGEDPCRRCLLGHIPVELVAVPVPLDRIKGRLFEIVFTAQGDRMSHPDRPRDIQLHPLETLAAAYPWKNGHNFKLIYL